MKNKNRPRREARTPKRAGPQQGGRPCLGQSTHTHLNYSGRQYAWIERAWEASGSTYVWTLSYYVKTRELRIVREIKPNVKINRNRPPHLQVDYERDTQALPLNWEIL